MTITSIGSRHSRAPLAPTVRIRVACKTAVKVTTSTAAAINTSPAAVLIVLSVTVMTGASASQAASWTEHEVPAHLQLSLTYGTAEADWRPLGKEARVC